MKKYLFLTVLWLLVARNAAAFNMPDRAYAKPRVFDEVNSSPKWEKYLENDISTYPKGDNPWRVFITDENAVAYTSSTSSAILTSDIHFMESFYVADVKDRRLLLFYCDQKEQLTATDSLVIPVRIRNTPSKLGKVRTDGYIGWVDIDNLLLWNICPYTTRGIFDKVAIAKDIDNATSGTIHTMPEMFIDKHCTVHSTSNMYVDAMDFYFVLKRDASGNVLVYKNYEIKDRMENERIGWLELGQFIDWNTRICWEPAFAQYDSHPINDYAYTFRSPDDAGNYDLTKKRSSTPLGEERKSTQILPRSPVLEYEDGVALLSVLSNAKGEDLSADVEKIINDLATLENSLAQVNVVFVMDATSSMKKCFPAMSKAVRNITKSDYYRDSRTDVRFGVVAYRNYKDKKGPYKFIESCPLTNQADRISDFLDTISNNCNSIATDLQEAMFAGLAYAADNMAWTQNGSNYIILIGDVTSKDPDEAGLTTQKIIQKLYEKEINLIAFQASNQGNKENWNFGSQVRRIIVGVLQQHGYATDNISNRLVDKANVALSLYDQPTGEEKWPLRPMGFQFSTKSNVDETELEALVTHVIKDFIVSTESNIKRLADAKAQAQGGATPDPSVCEELIRKRVIRKCEDLKGIIKVKGYAQLWHERNRMFVPCVFLAEKELKDLISEIKAATKSDALNPRGQVADVCKKLVLSYTGQEFDQKTIDSDFKSIIHSVEQECGYSFLPLLEKHITNPRALNEKYFNTLVERLATGADELTAILNENDPAKISYKDQDGRKYFYILLPKMPLVIQQ